MTDELAPRCKVIFDGMPPVGQLRFRVENEFGLDLLPSSGHIGIDEMEAWSDEDLRKRLATLSGGKL